MINIHANVSGTPTDTPRLVVDSGAAADGDLSFPGRVTFHLPDRTPPHGAWVTWAGNRRARTVIALRVGEPLAPGDYEGGLLYEPIPTLDYRSSLVRITVAGDQFAAAGQRWLWRGSTDFRLFQRVRAGEDPRAVVQQRLDAGANLCRVLAMKANNTGWELRPDYSDNDLRAFFAWMRDAGMYCEFVAFADTRDLMPDQPRQLAFWERVVGIAGEYTHILCEHSNEWNHSTQRIDPRAFPRPSNGVLTSHGSGQTDADPVRPLWDYATYHARRDPPPDGRGFTNYDPFAFQADWPKPCPFICDEGIKPVGYAFDPRWATQMGRHAAVGSGGTFHTDAGIDSQAWSPPETTCAAAFFQEMK